MYKLSTRKEVKSSDRECRGKIIKKVFMLNVNKERNIEEVWVV